MTTNVSAGEVLNRALEIYTKRFGILFGTAAVVLIPAAVIEGLLSHAGGMLGSLGGVVSLVASAVFTGAAVRIVQADDAGSSPGTIGEIFSSISDRIWPLVWVGFVASIAQGIGLLLLIVPGLFLLVIWSVMQPVIVVEGLSFDALARSRELVRGNGWNVFGLMVVVVLITLGVVALGAAFGGIIGGWVGVGVMTAIFGILLVPFGALIRTVLYFKLIEHGGGSGSAAAGV